MIGGGFNTFPNNMQGQPNMMNPNTQPVMGGNPLLPNPNVNDQFSQNYVAQIMKTVYDCQTSQDIQYVLPFLMNQQKQIIQQFNNCSAIEGITQYDEQYLKSIKERCLRLKNNNEIILIDMLGIKQKFSRILSLNIDRNPQKQEEFNIVHDKIRRVKMDLVNKLQNLKTRRLFDQTFNKNPQNRANRLKFAPINIALTELKNATQVINRQLIKQREEIRMLIKNLYDETI